MSTQQNLDLTAYNAAFSRKVHFWGRLTISIALVFSFSIPVYLTFIAGYGIDTEVLVQGMVFVLGFVGIIWLVEPISYFPVLGPIGNYMSFLSGNIGNMRMPVVGGVQKALDVEAGTKKAEMAAVFGLAASNVVNLVILLIVVVGGAFIVQILPEGVLAAFAYAIPGIIGAMIYTFGSKLKPKYLVFTAVLGILIIEAIRWFATIAPGPGRMLTVGQIGVAAVIAIIVAIVLARREGARAKAADTQE